MMADAKNEIPVIQRGSSATQTFDFPFPESSVDVLYITYQQMGSNVLEKTLADCMFATDKITVELTQEDILSMLPRQKMLIQIRGRLANGKPFLSNIMQARVDGELLKEGVV